jgi:hypothetical protein
MLDQMLKPMTNGWLAYVAGSSEEPVGCADISAFVCPVKQIGENIGDGALRLDLAEMLDSPRLEPFSEDWRRSRYFGVGVDVDW